MARTAKYATHVDVLELARRPTRDRQRRPGDYQRRWNPGRTRRCQAVAEQLSSYKPWQHLPWNGDLDAYREDLYEGMAFGLPDLPAFARQWLEELVRVGYHGIQEPLGLPPKRHPEASSVPAPQQIPLHGEAYPVRFEDARQGLWLRLDAGRSGRGYRNIVVSDAPLRTDRAIIAALTALEGRPLDTERLRGALQQVMPGRGESAWDVWTQGKEEPKSETETPERDEVRRDLQHHQAVDFVLTLLRHHRPGFDELSKDERASLVSETCAYVNAYLEALRRLVAFVEFGKPGRGALAATRIAERDVRAAVLRDVDGLTYREIGEEFGIPPPENFEYKSDHPTIRKMVERGRRILERALGEEGWRTQIEAMRSEAQRWFSLTEAEREAEIEAEALGHTPHHTPDQT